MKRHSIDECILMDLGKHPSDRLGNLTVVESNNQLPFDIRRVFFIHDVPGGENRGGHAHREIKEFIVAAAGSFMVTVDDGKERKTVMLNQPYRGLLVESGVWVTLHDFSSGAIALVLTSDHFSNADHIKDYKEFLRLANENTLS